MRLNAKVMSKKEISLRRVLSLIPLKTDNALTNTQGANI